MPYSRVEGIRKRKIYDARLAAEINGRFRAPSGEFHQTAAASAGQHVGHSVTSEGRISGGIHRFLLIDFGTTYDSFERWNLTWIKLKIYCGERRYGYFGGGWKAVRAM